MMHKLLFWRSWNKFERKLVYILIAGLVLSILYFVYNYFFGVYNVIHWETLTKLDQVNIFLHRFDLANLEIKIPFKNYVIFEYFNGSDLNINPVYAYIYLLVLVAIINLIMSLLPDFQKFWFYAGMGAFIGFAVLLNVDQILLFGQSDKTALIMLLGGYLSLGYFFKEIKPNISFSWRYVSFSVLSIILGLIYYQYAEVDHPFFFIANYGIYGPLLVTLLFIISVSHEIIYGLLYITTQQTTPKSRNTLLHFVLISLIYLVYVLLTYLKYTRQIDWDLVYLNPFLILVVTMAIGVWGFKQRQDLYAEIFSFKPVGFLLYLGFCIITLVFSAYIFSMGNDPIAETIEDAIIYSQLGFGVLFFVYVLSNFSMLIQKNYKVAKIVYQSRVFPFFLFRIGGLFIFGYIFYSSGFFPYYQALAGYYNGIGDVFLIDRNYGLAEQYYNEASLYEFQNHRSNYGMATLARKESDRVDEFYFFENSLLKKPTEFAYVNLANAYQKNNQYFDGLFKLKEGEQVFPKSGHVQNNLGFIYSRTDLADSAFYFFNSAYNNSWKRSIPASNILALLTKAGIAISTDSLEDLYKKHTSRNWIANNLASREQNGENVIPQYEFKLSSLSDNQDFALYYNAGLANLKTSDTTYFSSFTAMADTSGSEFFFARAMMLQSLNRYFNHQVMLAFQGLSLLANNVQNNAEINMLQGYLALERKAYLKAIEYFSRINLEGNDRLKFDAGICYMGAGLKDNARIVFNQLLSSNDQDLSALSAEYLELLEYDLTMDFETAKDEFKFLMIFYRHFEIPRDEIISYMSQVGNPLLRQLIQMHIANHYLVAGYTGLAQSIFEKTGQIEMEKLQKQYKQLAYRIASVSDNLQFSFDNNQAINSSHPLYLDRLLYEAARNQTEYTNEELTSMYMTLGTWDPFHEMGVIQSVDFFTHRVNDEILGYNLLYNALNLNSNSVPLGKKYVEQCILIGMNDYAMDGLNALKGKMPEADYKLFEDRMLSVIEENERAFMELGF